MDPLWKDLRKITAPRLLLWGRDYRTITLEGAQIMLKQIRDVQLHIGQQYTAVGRAVLAPVQWPGGRGFGCVALIARVAPLPGRA